MQDKVGLAEDRNYSFGTISQSYIRQFLLTQVYVNTISCLEMVGINSSNVSEPPLLKLFLDEEIENARGAPLKF